MCENYVGGGSPTVKTINTVVIFTRTQLGDSALSNQSNQTELLLSIFNYDRKNIFKKSIFGTFASCVLSYLFCHCRGHICRVPLLSKDRVRLGLHQFAGVHTDFRNCEAGIKMRGSCADIVENTTGIGKAHISHFPFSLAVKSRSTVA